MNQDFRVLYNINNAHYGIQDNMGISSNRGVDVSNLNEFLATTMNSSQKFNFNVPTSSNYIDKKKALNDVETLRTADRILGFDIETFGSIEHANTFAVTEFALVEKAGGNTNVLNSIKMGLSESAASEAETIVRKYYSGGMMNEGEMEAAKVMALRTEFNIKNYSDGKVVPNTVNTINSIRDIKSKGMYYGSEVAGTRIQGLHSQLTEAVQNQIPIVGHNIIKADIPWVNEMFKKHGLPEIDFSQGNVIDTLELSKIALNSSLYGLFDNAGIGNQKRQYSLESLAKLTGVNIDAHIASSDITANMDMLFSNVKGTNETLLDVIENNLRRGIEKGNINLNSDSKDKLLYANRSLNINNPLDIMVGSDGKPMTYRSQVSSRGLFYEIESFNFTPLEQLDNATRNLLPSNATGAYSIVLNSYGDGVNPHKAHIVRGSMEELTETIGGNFSVFNIAGEGMSFNHAKKEVSSEYARKQMVLYEKDLARRSYDKMFEVNSDKGYKYAENMYKSFETFNATLGENATIENLKTLVRNGEISIAGRNYAAEEVLPNLASKAQMRDFTYMYDTIADSYETVTSVMEEINKKVTPKTANVKSVDDRIKQYKGEGIDETTADKLARKNFSIDMNNEKTKVFKSVMDDFKEEFGVDVIKETVYDSLSYSNYASVKINGEYVNIDVSSEENAIKSFRSKIYGQEKFEKSNINKANLRANYIEIAANDLYERNFITKETLEKFQNIGDVNTAANEFGALLFDVKETVLSSNYMNEKGSIIETGLNLNPPSEFKGGFENEGVSLDKKIAEIEGNKYIKDKVNSAINSNMKFKDITISSDKGEVAFSKYITDEDGTMKINKKYIEVKNNISDFLENNLNYSNDHIEDVANAIAGSNSSYMNRGYDVSFTEYTDHNGNRSYGMVAYKPENADSVHKALAKGEMPSNAILHPLPKRNLSLDGSVDTVSVGMIEKKNIPELQAWFDKEYGELKFSKRDTISQAIRQPNMGYKAIDKAVENGNYEAAQQKVLRDARKSIMDSSGASSPRTVSLNGEVYKSFVPTMSDTIKPIKLDGIVPLIPQIYEGNKEIRADMEKYVGKDRLDEIIGKIRKKNDAKEVIPYSELNAAYPDFGEWFSKNLLLGQNIVGEVVQKEYVTGDIAAALGEIDNLRASQLLKEKDVYGGLYVSLDKPEDYNIGSHLNAPRRPQLNQFLQSQSLYKDEINEFASTNGISDIEEYFSKKRAAGVGITFSDIMQTRTAREKYFKPMNIGNKDKGGITLAMYGGVKQISPEDFQKAFINLTEEDKLQILKEFNDSNNANATIDQLEDLIYQYRASGTTNEQHGIVRPSVDKYMMFNDELGTVRYDATKYEFTPGTRIDSNTVIGQKVINGKTLDIHYKGPEGVIGNVDKGSGKFFVKFDEASFLEKKYMIGGFEKSVGTAITTGKNGEDLFDLSEFLYGKIFGENTMIAGYYALGKHEAGGVVIGGKLSSIASIINESSNTKANKEIVDIINKNMIGWNATIEKDVKNRKGRVLVFDTPKVNSNDFQNYRNLVEALKNEAANGKSKGTREMAQQILDVWAYEEKNNILNSYITKANLSESLSVAGENTGKGAKVSQRTEQVLGASYLKGMLGVNEKGEIEKIAQPIVDYHHQQLRGTKTYQQGKQELHGLISAARLNKGEVVGDNVRIATVNIKDIALPTDGTLTMEEFEKSLFGKYFGKADVIKLELNDNIIPNMYKENFEWEKRVAQWVLDHKIEPSTPVSNGIRNSVIKDGAGLVDHIYIGVSRANILDDNTVFRSQSMKSASTLITNLLRREELDFEDFGSLDKLDAAIVDNIKDIHKSLSYELNNKKGLYAQTMASGRVKFSGSTLSTGIVDYAFDESGKQILHPLGKQFIKERNGKIVSENVVFVSKQMIEDMGLTDSKIFNQIVRDKIAGQTYYDNLVKQGYINADGTFNIKSNEEFLKTLKPYYEINRPDDDTFGIITGKNIGNNKKRPLSDLSEEGKAWLEEKRAYERKAYKDYRMTEELRITKKVSEDYLENVGIPAAVTRHPTFHPDSVQFSQAKLHQGLTGKTSMITGAMGHGLNADIDGDTSTLEFFLKTGDDGEVALRNSDDPIIKASNALREMQENSHNEYIEKMKKAKNPENIAKEMKEFTLSVDQLESNYKDLYNIVNGEVKNTNYLMDEKALQTAIKARQNKSALGSASVKGFLMREMTNEALNADINALNKLKYVSDFTKSFEQKIIDVKHDVDAELSQAGHFSEAIEKMGFAKGNIEQIDEGFISLYNALMKSSVYDNDVKANMPTAQSIIDNSYLNMNLDGNTLEEANRLRATYELFQNEEAIKAFNDPLTNSKVAGYNIIQNNIDILEAIKSGEGSSTVARNKIAAVLEAGDTILMDGINVNEDSYKNKYLITKNGAEGLFDIAKIEEIGINDKGNNYVKIQDLISKETRIINASSNAKLGEILNADFKVIDNDGSQEALSVIANAKIESTNKRVELEVQNALLNADENFNKMVIAEVLDGKSESEAETFLREFRNRNVIEANYDDLMRKDNPIFEIQSAMIKFDNYNEKQLESIIDTLYDIERADKDTKKYLTDTYLTLAENTDEMTRRELAKSSLVVKAAKEAGEITESESYRVMAAINEDIKAKGKQAKKKRELKEADIKNHINAVTNETLSNSQRLSEITAEIDSNKYHSINGLKNETRTIIKDMDIASNEDAINILGEKVLSIEKDFNEKNRQIMQRNTELFVEAYNTKGGRESVLNWSSYNSDVSDIINSELSKSKIGFGKFANLSIGELSLQDLESILTDTKGYIGAEELIKESKERVATYLAVVNSDNIKSSHDIFTRSTNFSRLNREYTNQIDVNALNEEIIKRAQEKVEKKVAQKSKEVLNEVSKVNTELTKPKKWYKNKYLITAGAVTAAAGALIASSAGKQYLEPGGVVVDKNNGGNDSDETERDNLSYEAPSSDSNNRAMLQGVSMKIKGKNKGNVSTEEMVNRMGSVVSSTTGSQINVNTNETDSKKGVSDSWLKDKFKSLLR